MVVHSGGDGFTLRVDGEVLAVTALGSDEGIGVLSASDDAGIIVISAAPAAAVRTEVGRFIDEHPDLNALVVGPDIGSEAAQAITDVAGERGLAVDDGT